jgi:hypothetical protein
VTDQGFLQERNIVWESLNNIENDGVFVNSEFQSVVPQPDVSPTERKEQIDKDYLIALSMQEELKKQLQQSEQWDEYKQRAGYSELTDEELASKLQKEEEERYEQMQLRESKHAKGCSARPPPSQPESSVSQAYESYDHRSTAAEAVTHRDLQMQANQSYESVEQSGRARAPGESSSDSNPNVPSHRSLFEGQRNRRDRTQSRSQKKSVSSFIYSFFSLKSNALIISFIVFSA